MRISGGRKFPATDERLRGKMSKVPCVAELGKIGPVTLYHHSVEILAVGVIESRVKVLIDFQCLRRYRAAATSSKFTGGL